MRETTKFDIENIDLDKADNLQLEAEVSLDGIIEKKRKVLSFIQCFLVCRGRSQLVYLC